MKLSHVSVLKKEAIDALNISANGIYVDATLGRAGHSLEIVKQLQTGKLICFDLDFQALEESKQILSDYVDKIHFVHSNYANLQVELEKLGISEIDGILLDLGVSSPQFDDSSRGFSYRFDAKLDMRMNQQQALSAYDVVNQYEEQALSQILFEYGEEKNARFIAKNIVKARPIITTFELVEVIKKSYPPKELSKKGHPAKKTFQALRIEVNQELDSLKQVLNQAIKCIKPNGKIVVITFHSLEDRIVKECFNQVSKVPKTNRRLPSMTITPPQFEQKAIKVSETEIELNHRAHSAHLRILTRKEVN